MASNGHDVHGNSVVRYDGTNSDNVHVEVQSPAKNRAKGRRGVGEDKSRGMVLFERASRSWWNPKFDSPLLEKEVQRHYFPYTQRRFQYALLYVILASLAWAVYFAAMRLSGSWVYFLGGAVVLGVLAALVLLLTRFAVYERFVVHASLFLALLLSGLLLASFAFEEPDISLVGTFAGTVEVLLLFYTFIPLPLYVCAPLGVVYSMAYEGLVLYRYQDMQDTLFIVSKVLLHLGIHLLGIHIFITTQVRCRSNFWKVGQCVMARRDLDTQKQNQENMIHSLMPKSVADQVMTSRTDKDKEDEDEGDFRKKKNRSKKTKGVLVFRSFNMNQMEDVSILFADIVGFTKMSSNKTAEHLVGLLNDLFGRFDKLCTEANCEKISTLGDCYYCVAGCPEPRSDHAECCVKMGLGMIKAIQQFDEDNNESVNMRVGVHTGTVLCGIVGTRRFKFDVWSNDVTLANIMESSGRPGMVHISDASYELLKDKYEVEKGEDVEDLRSIKKLVEHYDSKQSSFTIKHEQKERVIETYFITGIKPGWTGPNRPSDDSFIVTLDIPERTEEVKVETSGASANSANHTDVEKSTNSVSTVVPIRNHSPSFLEGGEGDRMDEKVASTGMEVRGVGVLSPSLPPSSVHAHEPSPPPTAPVSSIAFSTPVSSNSNHNHLTSATPTPPAVSAGSPSLPPPPFQAFTAPYPSKVLKSNVVAISMVKRADDPMDTDPFNESWSQQVMHRDQRDQQMIHNLNKDRDLREFFSQPPVSTLTLFFTKPLLERVYRSHFFDLQDESVITSPRSHSFIETILSLILFLLISLTGFLVFERTLVFVVVFVVCLVLEVVVLVGLWADIKWGCLNKARYVDGDPAQPRDMPWWSLHNVVGVLMAVLPAAVVYANLSCDLVVGKQWQDHFLCFCVLVSLLCLCNFSILCSMFKSFVASLLGATLLILLNVSICQISGNDATTPSPVLINSTILPTAVVTLSGQTNTTTTTPNFQAWHLFSGENSIRFEIILDILLMLVLIWFLNRETEIGYRLSFYGSAQADKDAKKMQESKEQADWLLHNIIPAHVSDVVKRTHKYSKNHKDVGVIFATIINFNEFYDEGFEGGREYLRVLNELISDYEELLDRTCFKDVEKIKTISSSFMAASGLNEGSRNANKHPNAHLFALLDFSVELQNAIARFNESILNFNFVLNIGYNFGEVTSGVIGTTKLLYDIWGDTVNIASRMYSTGEPDRIQVPESTLEKLTEMFEFEYRGQISVKGKGEMKTYLYTGKKPGAHWE